MQEQNLHTDAIKNLKDNLRIIACAGSGKTKFVSERVAYLLDNGVKPENIISFTYTEKAADELNNRIVQELRKREILNSIKGFANMYIGTIHGWCLKALQDNELGYQKFSVLDEIKLKLFVDKNYNEIGMKGITKIGNPNVNMKIFTDTNRFIQIMNIVRESETKGLSDEIKQAKIKYETFLKSKGCFDFTMIMTEALSKLKDKSSALNNKVSSDLKFLIVDEFQDVNPIQEKIIRSLWKVSNCKVTVVGDDDQNIYQWRGSDSEFLQKFDEIYSSHQTSVKSLKLVKNFRSSKGITGLARTFIESNKNRIPKEMMSAEKQEFIRDEDILFNRYDTIEEENNSIIRKIDNLRGVKFTKDGKERGLDYSDFCILIRTWKKSSSIVEVLEDNDIPFITGGVNQLFDRKEVKASVAIFKYLNDEIDINELLELWKILIPEENIKSDSLNYAATNLSKWLPDSFQSDRKSVGWGDYNLQEIFWTFLSDARVVEETFITEDENSFTEAEIIFYNLGKFSQVINDFEEINLNSAPPSFHLFNFLNFVKYAAQDYYPEGWLNKPFKTPNAVQVMTIHQAKGLEFPVVFIPGLNSNYFPIKKPGGLSVWHFLERDTIQNQDRYEAKDDERRFEDERRLMYVGITRSQKFLFVSRAPDQSNRLYRKPSIFCNELVSDFIQQPQLEVNFKDRERTKPEQRKDKVTISLNFSVLKDFFECNYRFKLVSMYGFCFPLDQRMGLGKSTHDSFMAIHKKVTEGDDRLNEKQLDEIAEEQSHFPYIGQSSELKKMKGLVKDKVQSYYWKNVDDFDDIEFFEKDIKLNMDEGIFVSGRIDLTKRKLRDDNYETTILDFKSNDEVQSRSLNVDQLNLYALGYKQLTGGDADYIQIYDVEMNKPDHKSKINEAALNNTELKITEAANKIRNESFKRVNDINICSKCYQKRICSAMSKLNLNQKK